VGTAPFRPATLRYVQVVIRARGQPPICIAGTPFPMTDFVVRWKTRDRALDERRSGVEKGFSRAHQDTTGTWPGAPIQQKTPARAWADRPRAQGRAASCVFNTQIVRVARTRPTRGRRKLNEKGRFHAPKGGDANGAKARDGLSGGHEGKCGGGGEGPGKPRGCSGGRDSGSRIGEPRPGYPGNCWKVTGPRNYTVGHPRRAQNQRVTSIPGERKWGPTPNFQRPAVFNPIQGGKDRGKTRKRKKQKKASAKKASRKQRARSKKPTCKNKNLYGR